MEKRVPDPKVEDPNIEIAGLKAEIEKYKDRERDLEDSRRAMLYMLEDINETTSNLEKAKNEWEDTFNAIEEPVMILNTDFKIVKANRSTAEKLGIPQSEISGKTCYRIVHGLDCPHSSCPHSELLKDGLPHVTEIYEERLGGYYIISVSPIYDSNGKLKGSIHFGKNISERKKAEESLQQSEKRYRTLIESLTDYIYTVKIENGMPVRTVHGEGCVAVTGYTSDEYEADPSLWYRMIVDEDKKAVTEQVSGLLSGESVPYIEHRIIYKDGSMKWVKNTLVPRYDEKGVLVAYDGLISDITERKKLEEQLRHVQKMEAVGQIAGGIAHDFNNILTAIIGFSSLLQMKMSKDDPLMHNVVQVLAAAERAASLTQSLLTFSRKQVSNPMPVDLNEIIKRVEKFLRRVIGEDIEMKTRLSESDLIVMADHMQIEQVLMNLATNSRDALIEGGSLSIETAAGVIDEEYVKRHGYGKPGRYAVISVKDTGTGMDNKTREKVFEPFFTTKDVGKGTGLGLSIVYGIVKQHNGYINCYSEPGKGTTFRIYLPLIREQKAKKIDSYGPDYIKGGNETILLAEDEEQVRKLDRQVLESVGYEVIEAIDGIDAVNKFIENKDKVGLLLFDIIMPNMNGKEAYERIKKIKPEIKVLFSSGYPADFINKDELTVKGLDFISKPSSPTILLKKVREVLDGE